MADEPKQKKIIIDEDWKTQVEAEREADQNPQEKPTDADEDLGTDQMPWPEPSLPLLITTLATQAMAAMGLMVHPVTEQATTDLGQAKHFVDTIDMLQTKTQGNRSPEEDAMFENVLHELRMAFVAVQEKEAGL